MNENSTDHLCKYASKCDKWEIKMLWVRFKTITTVCAVMDYLSIFVMIDTNTAGLGLSKVAMLISRLYTWPSCRQLFCYLHVRFDISSLCWCNHFIDNRILSAVTPACLDATAELLALIIDWIWTPPNHVNCIRLCEGLKACPFWPFGFLWWVTSINIMVYTFWWMNDFKSWFLHFGLDSRMLTF